MENRNRTLWLRIQVILGSQNILFLSMYLQIVDWEADEIKGKQEEGGYRNELEFVNLKNIFTFADP